MSGSDIIITPATGPIVVEVRNSPVSATPVLVPVGIGAAGVAAGGDTGAVLVKSAPGDYLTTWLATTAFGRGLLALADAAGLRSAAGLANVDNTADAAKPVSTAQALAIAAAVADEAGTRAAADTALDGRLDVLEADPITATAVASGLAGRLAIASNLGDLNNAATARTNLGLGSLATQSGTFTGTSSGTNTGDQTITLTGDVTGTGTGSFAATVAANAITNAKAAQMAAGTIKGNNTGATANAADLTAAQVRGVLALPTSTVAGRLARYTNTAGAQGSTAGLFEDASGNVGIGTTTPANQLEIQSAGNVFARLYSTNASGYACQVFKGTGREYRLGVGGASEVTIGVANKFYIYDASAPAVRAVIDTSGNVGIGTTAPNTPLAIEANTNQLNLRQIGATWGLLVGAGTNYTSGAANSAFVINVNSGPLALGTGNTERMRIDSTGNVGIGTTSPVVALDVNGPIRNRSAYTVATLPAASLGNGIEAYVTDSTLAANGNLGTTVTGGGANRVKVRSLASAWIIAGA